MATETGFVEAYKQSQILQLERELTELRSKFSEMEKIIAKARTQITSAVHCLELAQRELSVLSAAKSNTLESHYSKPS